MKNAVISLSPGLFLLVAATALTGCGIGTQLDPSPEAATPSVTISGGLSGNNYGGHAPIVGAKIFLLQAGTSGYGSKSTSLLTSAAGRTDTTIVGPTEASSRALSWDNQYCWRHDRNPVPTQPA
jgi:hypothetical protein